MEVIIHPAGSSPPGQDFEAYLAKFKAKFTKDDCQTIVVTNKRLGTGQTPCKETLLVPHFTMTRLGLPVTK